MATISRAGKIASVILTISLIMLSIPFGSITAFADDIQADASNAFSYNNQSSSFYHFLQKYKDTPSGKNEIQLDIEKSKLLDNAEIITVDGRKAICLNESGSAVWQIEVEQSALYEITLDYCSINQTIKKILIGFKVDGQTPYIGADSIELKKIWEDDGEIVEGKTGNEIAPKQKQVIRWETATLQDYSSYYNGPYVVYLEKGEHSFEIYGVNDSVALDNIALTPAKKIPDYDEKVKEYQEKGYQPAGEVTVKLQAEKATAKSDSSIIPTYDRTSAWTESVTGKLNEAGKIRRNTIGQSRWSDPGMWIEYSFTVPRDGLYTLAMRTRQNKNVGMSTLRDIYIDGEIPFKEAQGFVFPYKAGWTTTVFGENNQTPYYLYLKKGPHTIRFVATLNRFSPILESINEVNGTLSQLYRKIVMVTGISPDVNRDYRLDAEIPGLMDTMQSARDSLEGLAEDFISVSQGNSNQVTVLKSIVKQLNSFIKDPDTIPGRLANFQANISSLSDWLLSIKSQALEIDYLLFTGNENEIPLSKNSFMVSLRFSINRFLASFIEDYNTIGEADFGKSEKIKVWFNGSRDQAQIILDMINSDFIPKYNISVNLNLVYQGYIEAILAGSGPDLALDVARSYPVNLAARGALLDLSQFESFSDVIKRFSGDATLPYTYKGKVYGLPSTQSFFMMFYRTDIFDELGLKAPNTWAEFDKLIPTLQRKNLEIGLPYSTITIAGTATGGIGAKDMYATLLMQKGGTIYSDDFSSSNLNSSEAFEAFNDWIRYYSTYGFPITYSLFTRFRSGTLPLFIAAYSTYNVLMGAAPEIRGLWEMVPIPGTVLENGTIDRSTGATGTANVIFSNTKNPQACWSFLDWWTSTDVQYQYALGLEELLGVSARSTTANIEAFDRLDWSQQNREALKAQREFVKELPETLGSYIVSRSLDNAFRAVVYNGRNPRERFEQEVLVINEELLRKQKEFS